MQPAERIAAIKRISSRLGAEDDWFEIDLVLEQFGFPTWDQWEGTKLSYVHRSIKDAPSDMLEALDRYLMGDTSPSEEPWESGRFRLFISHVAGHRKTAHELKSFAGFYGIDGFVAHDDIAPGKEWRLVIESALASCDALVALLHEGFKESDWCDQEVGFALGRGVPVVPIRFDLDPYGFFGAVQAITPRGRELKAITRDLVDIYLADKRTSDRSAEGLVAQLEHAVSFSQANALSALLADDGPVLSQEQVARLHTALKSNNQLQGAWDFESNLAKLQAKVDLASPAPANSPGYDPDEEPW